MLTNCSMGSCRGTSPYLPGSWMRQRSWKLTSSELLKNTCDSFFFYTLAHVIWCMHNEWKENPKKYFDSRKKRVGVQLLLSLGQNAFERLFDFCFCAQLHWCLAVEIFHSRICSCTKKLFHFWGIVFCTRHQQQQIDRVLASCIIHSSKGRRYHPWYESDWFVLQCLDIIS